MSCLSADNDQQSQIDPCYRSGGGGLQSQRWWSAQVVTAETQALIRRRKEIRRHEMVSKHILIALRLRTLVGCSVFAAPIFVACDSNLFSEGPSAVCTESGAQCQLSAGPLGVCERSPCSPGASSPCFQCTSQH